MLWTLLAVAIGLLVLDVNAAPPDTLFSPPEVVDRTLTLRSSLPLTTFTPTVAAPTATVTPASHTLYLPYVARVRPGAPSAPVLSVQDEAGGGYSVHWTTVAGALYYDVY